MANKNKNFLEKAREAYQYAREKLSPTLDAAYSTYKESISVAGDLVEGTKSAWKFAKAGGMLVEATATLVWSAGKAVFYDAPSAFKAKYYDKDEKTAAQSYDATVKGFTTVGESFMTGIDAGVGMARNGVDVAYYAGDATYHTAKAAYYVGSTAYNAAVLAAEGVQVASSAVVNGAYQVAQALEKAYDNSRSVSMQSEESVELKPITLAFAAEKMRASALMAAEQTTENELSQSFSAAAA